ncbi:MAG: hypothetical protein R3D98_14460 [Candidatus Krumholzibacteriia bacterium]
MLRLVRNLALGAALITVAVAVWRDYGALITLKRAFVAYLATFFVSGFLVFLASIGMQVNRPPAPPPEPSRRQKRLAAEAAAKAARAASDALHAESASAKDAAPQPEPAPPEAVGAEPH